MRVDLDERKIDFELIAGGTKSAPGQRDGEGRGREPGNADVRKSRELKKALLDEAKGGRKGKGEKSAAGKSRSGSAKPKSAARSGDKPSAASGGPRKRKAKS